MIQESEIEKAAENYAHNYFEMNEDNYYKALKQGFIAGTKSEIAKKCWLKQSKKEKITFALDQLESISVGLDDFNTVTVYNLLEKIRLLKYLLDNENKIS